MSTIDFYSILRAPIPANFELACVCMLIHVLVSAKLVIFKDMNFNIPLVLLFLLENLKCVGH